MCLTTMSKYVRQTVVELQGERNTWIQYYSWRPQYSSTRNGPIQQEENQ